MRKFCALVILTLSLTLFAYADDGHMDCPGGTPPPPPPTPATAPGEMLTPIVEVLAVLLSLS